LFAKRRNDQGPWQPTGSAGVAYKTLYLDQSTGLVTRLVRMEPGARNPSHTHGHTEQCLILEGDLRHGEDNVYRAGDFTWGEAGSVDPELYTLEGNLLLIVTEA